MLRPPWRDPNRLFPVDPRARTIARDLFEGVQSKPILSPHGHVPISWLADNELFADPSDLFITHDHYITRLLHADGVKLETLAEGPPNPRDVWRAFASRSHLFAGTASGYWVDEALSQILGITEPLSVSNADSIYDDVLSQLRTEEFRPRALFSRFGIEFLATTDDPLDDLLQHEVVASSTLVGRVVPTFRPDKYMDPDGADFVERVLRLTSTTDQPTSYGGYLDALRDRRAYFIRHGAVSADHGVEEPYTADLDQHEAAALFDLILAGDSTPAERREFRAHMLTQMAMMSVEDGLVMTLHAGVLRNHHTQTFERYGPDTGHDIPVRTDFARGLRPLLERWGLERNLHLVLFTVDETAYSRDIAPLAGFYPSVLIGAPWWFLDAPDAIARFRSSVTETAGFYRGSGFIDDTRAFLSIPARHDTARRADAAFLARLVVEGRISVGDAERIATDLVDSIPRRAFKL